MRWRPILLGQVLAGLNTATGVFTELLVQRGLNIPVFQMCWLYFVLWVVYLPMLMWRKCGELRATSFWKFGIASLFDSQANVIIVMSYQYTSITSVLILLNSTLLWVVLLTYVFLKRRYSSKEYYGVLLAMTGVLCIVISDLWVAEWQWSGSIFGDCLALASALLYASSNVWQEHIMTTGTTNYEFLSLLGILSSLLTLVESLPLEIPEIKELDSLVAYYYLIGFVASMFGLYSISPFYFQWYGASLFNMSLLTSNAYALVFSVCLFDQTIQWLYFVGYAFVVVGIFLYNHSEPKKECQSGKTEESLALLSL